jgi:small-conductance mechanosensitive channel
LLDYVRYWLSTILTAFGRPLLVLAVLILLFVAYKLSKRALKRYMAGRAQKPENVQNFLLIWRYVWLGAGAIIVIVSFSGSIAALGLSAAFLGMVIGWSLQAPVTGIAAWLMIILKRPFKIGDRVIISGIIGDVTDINLTHVVLNQVGGTIGGEEKSGRGVLIPNATLFQQVIYNYAFETNYILDEVVVNITFESDLDEAEKICLEAARTVTADIVEQTGQQPFIRAELMDWGLRIRLRYQTPATDRQRVSSEVVQIIFRQFARNEQVEFCYPHSEVLHRPKGERPGGGQGPPPYLSSDSQQ